MTSTTIASYSRTLHEHTANQLAGLLPDFTSPSLVPSQASGVKDSGQGIAERRLSASMRGLSLSSSEASPQARSSDREVPVTMTREVVDGLED